MPPLVIQVLVPLSTHSSLASSYSARVRRELTSDPASGSDTAKAASLMSSGVPKHWGAHSTTCSGVPLANMPATPRVDPKIARAMPASPQAISSLTMGSSSPVGSAKQLATNSKE